MVTILVEKCTRNCDFNKHNSNVGQKIYFRMWFHQYVYKTQQQYTYKISKQTEFVYGGGPQLGNLIRIINGPSCWLFFRRHSEEIRLPKKWLTIDWYNAYDRRIYGAALGLAWLLLLQEVFLTTTSFLCHCRWEPFTGGRTTVTYLGSRFVVNLHGLDQDDTVDNCVTNDATLDDASSVNKLKAAQAFGILGAIGWILLWFPFYSVHPLKRFSS